MLTRGVPPGPLALTVMLTLSETVRPLTVTVSAAPAAVSTSVAHAGPSPPLPEGGLYLGGDLSYVNEMEDCGAVYRKAGKPVDPFQLLKAEGGNIVRVRIWNDAKWTKYSD